ncbi:hypothetical protein SAMN05421663_102250 [Terribacillus halophilus]|uniref:Resolvase/invertase-type recombinase catalytic domain-containing protein n=1 Tax=Terribacillus halophilus TaxID=361279 RepID=A0A1G6L410_9BACI|nr:hypothetical protein [Terribacillus halophilus]SDC38049.1 hypothetical protein SAMN05421663_102250 [Terribacillus halophilus]
MANAIVYYRLSPKEEINDAVATLKKSIKHFEDKFNILRVYFESPQDSNELLDLSNSSLELVDLLIVNSEIKDDFNNKLIVQLSKAYCFEVKFLSELINLD